MTTQNKESKQTEQVKEKPATADRIGITYYTDPLCCWSWAMEPHWKKLKEEFAGSIKWKYVMAGMIPDWKTYNDPVNAISKPLQLGPVWMHASQLSGVPMDTSIWHSDPPASSFPSCIAVKSAMLQSAEAGELLLNRLREAVMSNGLNIARETVILKLAEALAKSEGTTLSYEKFRNAWDSGAAVEAFRNDLQEVRFLKIGRYPTLTFSNGEARAIIVTGYRPYDVLRDALVHMMKNAKVA